MTTLYCADPILDATVRRLLGPAVTELLGDPRLQEVSANHDVKHGGGLLFVDYGAGAMHPSGIVIASDAIEAATLILATDCGKSIDPDAAFLNRVLACGFRYHAALTGVSDGPRFSIRTHQRRDWRLRDFARESEVHFIRRAVHDKKTILIGGATSSGKTSLLSAIIAEVPVEERLIEIEDEAELNIRAGNVIRGRTTAKADLKRHVFEALRDRPDRIVVGEVRGAEAYDMLDAFATGHAGGFATIHANGATEVLTRLARLASCDERLIREAIKLVLFVERQADGRRAITQIKEL